MLLTFHCSPREEKPANSSASGGVSSIESQSKAPETLFQEAKKYYDAKDFAEAAPLMIAAAEKGSAEAQMRLGKMYFNGWGVPHDHEKAVFWHKKAAAQGNQESIEKLKKMGISL